VVVSSLDFSGLDFNGLDFSDSDAGRCQAMALVMPEVIEQCCGFDGHGDDHVWWDKFEAGIVSWSDDGDDVQFWVPKIYLR
tara:strand:- start:139 stop:381 length:243 start_codon:yes stop_codon:yes gene_type:complete